jgi:chemotaxis signal transduction protein
MVSSADSEDAVQPMSLVLVRSGSRVCGLPLGYVVETMRPLPLTRFLESPGFVRGVAIIRGRSTPVVDLGLLLEGRVSDAARRFLTLRVESGHLALAVDEVLGIRNFPHSVFHPLPPLLGGLEDALVERLGVLDSNLLTVLRASRILPAHLWRQVMSEAAP